MRPDPRAEMKSALDRGPDFLPADLFEGSRAAQYRALKAYANTISHGRYAALEDSFPKAREAIGKEAFHRLAETYLADDVLNRPLRLIGAQFPDHLAAHDRDIADLAASEWAMLEAHGAAEADALTVDAIKGLTPEALVDMTVAQHPATKILSLRNPEGFPDEYPGEGPLLLVTRPAVDVLFARIGEDQAALLGKASAPIKLGALLEENGAAVMPLVEQGALRRIGEQE